MSNVSYEPHFLRSRKEYCCIVCAGPIVKGENYVMQQGFFDGAGFTNRYHKECWDELAGYEGLGAQFEFTPYSGEYPERVSRLIEEREIEKKAREIENSQGKTE